MFDILLIAYMSHMMYIKFTRSYMVGLIDTNEISLSRKRLYMEVFRKNQSSNNLV